MIIGKVKKALNYNEYVIVFDGKDYNMVFEILGTDGLQEGDKILLHEKLLDRKWAGYTQPYAFAVAKGSDAELVKMKNDAEFIAIKHKDENIVLKRIYG